jgi:Leucine-rich repeat (LRR) protein
MDNEPGDDYLCTIASFIRTNESRLAEAAFQRRRRRQSTQSAPTGLSLNPLQWFSSDSTSQSARPKPLPFTIDTHHLFYILIRLEALGFQVGSLDSKAVNPSRPINYVDVSYSRDSSDSISLSSIRTSLSAVSRLSLGVGLWSRPEPLSVDQELKYIFSSFTKIPALSLQAPGPKKIAEIAADPPNENALPLDSFRNLQSLECIDIDPRTLLGWDRLSESLWSLTVKRSGLDDVSDLFINAVKDDSARRQASPSIDPHNLSRQSSFHSTRLPDSVEEHVEETVVTPTSEDPPQLASPTESTSSPQLPPSKWAFLKHLSLADNALTFIPADFLPHLCSLTHLDLSSNLLVSIPPALSSLYNLVSLNLSDNMIDSVLGIYKMLGQVLVLNLSRNRLDSLCGLERLMALERVDVRHNQLEESGEVGRLSLLPNITEVWVEGNAFTEIESDYRVKCFDFFWKEGKSILVDGTVAGFYERRSLTAPPSEQMNSTRHLSKAHSPPVVPVGGAATPTAPPPTAIAPAPSSGSSSSSPVFSPAPSTHQPSPLLSTSSAKPRKKRMKRIVHLDADANAVGTWASVSSDPSETFGSPTRSPRTLPVSLAPAPAPAEDNTTPTVPVVVTPKHRRSQTEYTPPPPLPPPPQVALAESDGPPSPVLLRPPADRTMSVRVSSRRSAARRARAAASVFEAPGKAEEGSGEEIKEADAFRARVEALRSEMGDGWLKVFSQSHAGAGGSG